MKALKKIFCAALIGATVMSCAGCGDLFVALKYAASLPRQAAEEKRKKDAEAIAEALAELEDKEEERGELVFDDATIPALIAVETYVYTGDRSSKAAADEISDWIVEINKSGATKDESYTLASILVVLDCYQNGGTDMSDNFKIKVPFIAIETENVYEEIQTHWGNSALDGHYDEEHAELRRRVEILDAAFDGYSKAEIIADDALYEAWMDKEVTRAILDEQLCHQDPYDYQDYDWNAVFRIPEE